jgi:heptaprenyl diphosphate synthase
MRPRPACAPEQTAAAQDGDWLKCREVQDQLRLLDDVLRTAVRSDSQFVSDIAGHLLRSGGKRLRPALMLLAARFGPAQPECLLTVAAGIELLHVASLYLDDVIDRAAKRRRIASANARWGNQAAVVAGDYLLALATQWISAGGDDVTMALASTVERMWSGQMLEGEAAYDLDVDEETIAEVIRLKTGSLYECACRIGAILAGAEDAEADMLGEYGASLGIAFQLVDDVMDIAAEPSQLGKQPGSDLLEGVYTLPVIRTLEGALPGRERLRALLAGARLEPDALREALVILRRNGSLEAGLAQARNFAQRANLAIKPLPAGPVRQSLEDLSNFVVSRFAVSQPAGAPA